MGGWVAQAMWRVAQAMWWLRITLIIRLSQPSLAGVGAGAELGNEEFKTAKS